MVKRAHQLLARQLVKRQLTLLRVWRSESEKSPPLVEHAYELKKCAASYSDYIVELDCT